MWTPRWGQCPAWQWRTRALSRHRTMSRSSIRSGITRWPLISPDQHAVHHALGYSGFSAAYSTPGRARQFTSTGVRSVKATIPPRGSRDDLADDAPDLQDRSWSGHRHQYPAGRRLQLRLDLVGLYDGDDVARLHGGAVGDGPLEECGLGGRHAEPGDADRFTHARTSQAARQAATIPSTDGRWRCSRALA